MKTLKKISLYLLILTLSISASSLCLTSCTAKDINDNVLNGEKIEQWIKSIKDDKEPVSVEYTLIITGEENGEKYRMDPYILKYYRCENDESFRIYKGGDNDSTPPDDYYLDKTTGNIYVYDYNLSVWGKSENIYDTEFMYHTDINQFNYLKMICDAVILQAKETTYVYEDKEYKCFKYDSFSQIDNQVRFDDLSILVDENKIKYIIVNATSDGQSAQLILYDIVSDTAAAKAAIDEIKEHIDSKIVMSVKSYSMSWFPYIKGGVVSAYHIDPDQIKVDDMIVCYVYNNEFKQTVVRVITDIKTDESGNVIGFDASQMGYITASFVDVNDVIGIVKLSIEQ